MALSSVEGFLLLTLPNTTLITLHATHSGSLALECISVPVPGSSPDDKDVYLVIKLNAFEAPIDPKTIINSSIARDTGLRTYRFNASSVDGSDFVLKISPPANSAEHEVQITFMQDMDTFDSIISQYAQVQTSDDASVPYKPIPMNDVMGSGVPGGHGDLRGHLVVVDQDNGQVVGEFDKKFQVTEDTQLGQKGHEDDPVIIEVPEGKEGYMEVFVRAVPPEERNWITSSATVVSHVISTTTSLLLTSISAASNYYISHSKPSPHHPDSIKTRSATEGAPPPLPPRALVFLTSERTRKGLAGVHAVTGHAVRVSSKTVSLVEGMIRRTMGNKAQKAATNNVLSPSSRTPSRVPSPVPSIAPPSYTTSQAMAQSPIGLSPAGQVPPPLPQRKSLSTAKRVLLSADLILSTIDTSTRQLLDNGGKSLSNVVGHKYGPEAAQNTLLFTGTGKNLVLVYIDMRGIGRRALLKTAGKEFVKGRVGHYHEAPELPGPSIPKR